MSKRESVLQALHALIQSAVAASGARVLRGDALPETIPAGGLVILRDGDPGEPDVTMSPLLYHFEHRAEIEVLVQDAAARDAVFDAICAAIGQAVVADRTLGGLCDWIEALAPAPSDLPVTGGIQIKAGMVPVILAYSTADPLN